ncbi:hypothetical protein [Pseudalkalibacillus salsuginis]|uniref:hypothetical protein n=1 Tax=Pseudalkalibacillus salsuginis TaxID=2910972 RepID=UPI001F339589|nr:hypothetical protein [Pseudalkalibacillus salsuginis]MCF6410908.1 hypothetical protein [Pseudalkalibacillus salsuginis]
MKKAIFLSAAVLLGACSPMQPPTTEEIADNEPSAYETKENNNPLVSHGIINYHATNRRPNTNYFFETNQNPNSYRNLTMKRFTISDDQDKIREAVKDAYGREPQFVSINGNNAWVHVNVPRDLSAKERKALKEKLEDAIWTSVPRYQLTLRLDSK